MIGSGEQQRLLLANSVDEGHGWQSPQLGVQPGEVLLDAMHRELREEVGLPRSSVALLGNTNRPVSCRFPAWFAIRDFVGQMQRWFLLRTPDVDRRSVGLESDLDVAAEFSEVRRVEFGNSAALVAEHQRHACRQALSELEPMLRTEALC